MNPYRRLGIEGDADERAIKRAYARLLKQHRPDEDAAAFQRLHEAYEHCLQAARRRKALAEEEEWENAGGGDADLESETGLAYAIDLQPPEPAFDIASPGEPERPVPAFARAPASVRDALAEALAGDPAGPAPLAELSTGPVSGQPAHEAPADAGDNRPRTTEALELPARRDFPVDEFIDKLLTNAQQLSATSLDDWLNSLDELYSVGLKLALRAPVAHALAEASPMPHPPQLQVVMDFFGLDSVTQGDAWLHHRIHSAWRRAESEVQFERTIEMLGSKRTKPVDRLLLREALGPFNGLRRLFVLMVPLLPSRLRSLQTMLAEMNLDLARRRLDAGSFAFWAQVTDRDRLHWRRAMIVVLRVPFYYLAIVGPAAWLVEDPSALAAAPGNCALIVSICLLSVTVGVTWRWLSRRAQARLGWDLSVAVVLALWLVALVLAFAMPDTWFSLTLVPLAVWIYRHRQHVYPTLAAALAGICAVFATLALFVPVVGESSQHFALALSGGSAALIGHDLVRARLRRIGLHEVRLDRGALWWVALVCVAWCMLAPMAASALGFAKT